MEGIELTHEQAKELRMVRQNGMVMSEAIAFPSPPDDPLGALAEHPEDAVRGKLGYWVKAMVSSIRKVAKKKKKEVEETNSKQIARANRTKRIFDRPIDDPDAIVLEEDTD